MLKLITYHKLTIMTFLLINLLPILKSVRLNNNNINKNTANTIITFKDKKSSYDTDDQELIYYAKGKCTSTNCNKCESEDLCQCPNGYAQDPSILVTDDVKSCQYKRKKQYIFFLLELLLPFGVGHLYACQYLIMGIKLITCIIIFLLDFFLKRKIRNFRTKQQFHIFILVLFFMYLIGHLVDIILIGINQYKDGNQIAFTTLY